MVSSDVAEKGEKIRILYVAQAAGGVDRYLRMLLKYLDHEKFENILVCSQDYNVSNYADLTDGIKVINMSRSIGLQDVSLTFTVRKLIKKYNPDIVYAHSSKAGAVARLADIGLKNACIYNPHGWAFNMRTSKNKRKLYRFIERLAAPFCDKIVCISESEKKSALENKICSENKLKVIYNGIDIDEYEKSTHNLLKRSELGIQDEAFVVGMVGRLSEQKAPDVFVKVAGRIREAVPESYFIIVGDGELENEVREEASHCGVSDRLVITGWVENPLDYVELFDVAVLLSRWEGFGLVLPEYMMVGKPIVTTGVDAIPEIVEDGKSGLLVEADDVEGAYKAILRLYEDADLRKRLSESGRGRARTLFNVKRVAAEHEKLFMGIGGIVV